MWKCSKCKEECEDNFNSCWSCGIERDGTPPAEPFLPEQNRVISDTPPASSTSRPSKSGKRSVMSRYTDAYLIARTVTAFGATVKSIAFVIAFVTGVAVLASALATDSPIQYAVGGILLGVIVAIPIYVLGILVSTQGQILKATLDTAVNSSPLLTKDEMRQIMSLD